MLIDAKSSALLVVDVQERLAPAISGAEDVVRRIELLLRGAAVMHVPAWATEQYADGLGSTIERVARLVPRSAILAKTHFAATEEPGVRQHLADLDRRAIIVTGMEAHVCVLQTSLGLKALGYDVYLVADAVGSRREMDRQAAVHRLAGHGIEIVTAEMVMFEWLRYGPSEPFRALLPLLR